MDKLDMYIRQARQHGQTDKEIQADLIEAGWEEADIKHGLAKPRPSEHHKRAANHETDQGSGLYNAQPPLPDWEGAFSAYGRAIKAIRQNSKPAIFYVVVLALASMATNLLVNRSLVVKQTHFVGQLSVEVLVILIFLPFTVRYPLSLAKGKKLTIAQLCQASPAMYVNLIITLIIVGVLYALGGLTLGILLIWFLPWCLIMLLPVVDLNCSPAAAFAEARRLAYNNKGKAWTIFLVSLLPSIAVALLGSVPVLGSVLSPIVSLVYYTAAAFLYVWLRENVEA